MTFRGWFISCTLFMAGMFTANDLTAQSTKPVTHTTIVYELTVTKKRHTGGLEETYNGGTRALFITPQKVRIRLVSLMRIQSEFFDLADSGLKRVTIVKESGTKKYLFRLNAVTWKQYNQQYNQASCDTSFTDSATIAGYPCRKALIRLEDDKTVTVYYTDSIAKLNNFIDPLFRTVPGVVLQYEFSTKRGSVQYKATRVSHQPISPKVFQVPVKGVTVRKYRPSKKAAPEEDNEDAAGEEDQ